MKKQLLILILLFIKISGSFAQGYNHQWLLGYFPYNYNKARMYFDSSTYSLQTEFRKMPFEGTEANICDNNGNFLMSSNGVWIANATGDTMLNGSGLNPCQETASYPNGLLLDYGNVILPFNSDTNKFVLFHHVETFDGFSYTTNEIMQSVIDMTLDSGLGGVVLKNDTILQDTLNSGFGACKHANGRDWWVVVQKHNSDLIFKFLLTPNGIQSVTSQHLNVPNAWYNVTHLDFSKDGNKFAYYAYDSVSKDESVFLFDFDRCTGIFSNPNVIPITIHNYLWGLTFSPNSQLLYACTSTNIFQIDVNTLSVDTVAWYDGFYFPSPGDNTTFWDMYLAANSKIYITTGNSGQYIHEINYPDSAGVACDVQQHSIFLNAWNFRAVPNHPNYYLGPVIGSVCDSLAHVGIQEHYDEIQNFKIYPNPLSTGNLQITYLLPQNLQGYFDVYDATGRKVYTQLLPPWSSLESINLFNLNNGVYQCVIYSGHSRVSKKLVVLK